MPKSIRCPFGVWVALALAANGARADPIEYEFSRYFDAAPTYNEAFLLESPVNVNNSGLLAFTVSLQEAVTEDSAGGLFLTRGGAFTPVVAGGFPGVPTGSVSTFAVSDTDILIFAGSVTGLGSGIFSYRDGVLSPIPLPSDVTVSRLSYRAINDNGEFVFRGFRNGIGGIFLAKLDGSITTIAEIGTDWIGVGSATINDHGVVAFVGRPVGASGGGVFVYDEGVVTTVLEPDGVIEPFGGTPTINNAGEIGYLVRLESGDEAVSIIDASTGETTVLVDTSGPLAVLHDLSLNDRGVLAFAATLNDSSGALFTVHEGESFVVADGESLGFEFSGFDSQPGITNSGDLFFQVTPANSNVELIMRARPIPEPSTLVLLALAAAAVAWRRRRDAV